jgi:hypothetical protein
MLTFHAFSSMIYSNIIITAVLFIKFRKISIILYPPPSSPPPPTSSDTLFRTGDVIVAVFGCRGKQAVIVGGGGRERRIYWGKYTKKKLF